MYIAVLAGGLSPERDVSLSSGVMAANAMMSQGHKVCLVDLFMGRDDVPGDPRDLFQNEKPLDRYIVPEEAPDLDQVRASRKSGLSDWVGNGVVEICKAADITYLALHGADGENGRLQAFLDLNGIRYTGSSYFGCALAMDKWVTKQLLHGAGITTPDGILLKKGEDIPSYKLPCVIKPCCGGSSIGISIAHTEEEYKKAIEEAFRCENTILVEECISGRELTCGILDGKALPLTEIIPREGFYDYAHKNQPGWTEEITPARLNTSDTVHVQKTAEKVFEALHLEIYGRIDFILTDDGMAYCLEANTLPGMTPTSLLPQGAAETGIDYPSLCDKIINLSLKKYQ